MITGTKEYLDDIAKNYVCSEHQTPVVVAWHAKEDSYVLRCGVDTHKETAPLTSDKEAPREFVVPGHYPEEVTRQLSLSELNRAGELPPGPIKDNILRRERQKKMTNKDAAKYPVLGDLPRADLATGEMLLPEVVQALIVYAKKYLLDAYRGHVVVMYGKPYIGLDGYLYHANRTGKPYQLNSRPLTAEELPLFKVPEGAHAWLAAVKFTDTSSYFTGIGVVTQEEMTAKSSKDATKLRSPVVAAHPWQLAQKRAEWQALRRAFPIGETEEE